MLPSTHHTGSRYADTKDLPLGKVTEQIRADLKAAAATADSPLAGLTFRVRKSGGDIVTVDVEGLTDAELYIDPTVKHRVPENYTPRWRAVHSTAEAIVNAYNYDRSQLGQDYYERRFCESVYLVDNALRTAIQQEKERNQARRTTRS